MHPLYSNHCNSSGFRWMHHAANISLTWRSQRLIQSEPQDFHVVCNIGFSFGTTCLMPQRETVWRAETGSKILATCVKVAFYLSVNSASSCSYLPFHNTGAWNAHRIGVLACTRAGWRPEAKMQCHTLLHDLHNLHNFIHVLSGSDETLQHQHLVVVKHITIQPAHDLESKSDSEHGL